MTSDRKGEKTEVLYGTENAVSRGIKFMSNVRENMDICFDSRGPSIVMEVDAYRNGYINIRRRGGKIRAFTEITSDNLHYCKKLMKLVDELRHLDGTNGGIAVNETEYMATSVLEEAEPLTQVIYSNVPELVRQGHYIFDTFWKIAIPAEYRMKQIEEGLMPEHTEITYGEDRAIEIWLLGISLAKKTYDLLSGPNGPAMIVGIDPIFNGYIDLKGRGVRTRCISQITPENTPYCRKLMEFSDLRHLDGIKGYFGIIDSRVFGAHARDEEGRFLPHIITSTVTEFVEQQQYFFDALWNKAIPARQRLREIEEGIKPDFVETISEPDRVQKLAFDLVREANDEILTIFSTANAFHRQEKAGSMRLMLDVAKRRGIKIRIMTPMDDRINETIENLRKQFKQEIDIRVIAPALQTRSSILIVDRKYSLSVELKDDTKETSLEAIGFATYSNSESTVLSYVSF
ncbi:MAG TPA: hypothetical protein VLA68_01200, partial [Nitrososphaera sp.]|nr:hypothetical protein [Nitrososphaera sp.]